MLDLLVMIGCCTMLAYVVKSRTQVYTTAYAGIRRDGQSKFLYFVIVIWAIMFAGLRTRYNDTYNYIQSFNLFVNDEVRWEMLFEPYGGFEMFQTLIKRVFNANPQMLIFISSAICCILTFSFIIRNTKHFTASIFLFFIYDYIFLMAGIKQAVAIAIALWAIDAYLNGKYIRAIVLLILAMTFHPYIICLCCIPFLKGKVWNLKTIIMAIIFAIAFANLELVFEFLSVIGKDYSNEAFTDYTINPFRVIVEFIPVAVSFIYRKNIQRANDRYLTLGVNMRFISFIFIFLGLFYNPIYLGRMSMYYSMLSVITIPKMLEAAFKNEKHRSLLSFGYYLFFGLYFLLDLSKLGSISLLHDQFKHVSIFSLFK